MPSVIIVVLLFLVSFWKFLEHAKYDPGETSNAPSYSAKALANNAFYYTTTLYSYAVNHGVTTTQAVTNDDLQPYIDTRLSPLLDYQLALVNYNGQPFLINSWGDVRIKQLGNKVEDVMGELSYMANQRIVQSNNTFWDLPIVGENNNCNFIPKSYITLGKLDAVESAFANICQASQNQLGVKVKQYVIFERVFESQ